MLKALAELADQALLESFGLRFGIVWFMTGAQDCHGRAVDIG
jgi:hypothetical protein